MPVEETAADQPTAETESEQFTDDSLPADSDADSPSETQTADEAEGTESVESESEGDTEGTGETETESQPDEFLAGLTREELAYYAKRYPTLYKAYQDPNQPADLRQAFMDRVNQDHAYAELRDGQGEAEGEPTSEEAPTTVPDATEQRKQYYSQIDDIVSKQIDPQAVNELGTNMLEAMGVDLKSKDPDVQAIVKNAPKLGAVLARGAVDLLATTLPGLIGSRLEAALPRFSKFYQRALHSDVWDEVREGNKAFSSLPSWGTPEFKKAIDAAISEIPGLDDMWPNLPVDQRIGRQYALVAKLMTGQKVTPAAVTAAVETGKLLARKAEVTRAAGRALGGGRSTQQLGQQSDDDDPVMADLDRAIVSANESLSPLSRPKKR